MDDLSATLDTIIDNTRVLIVEGAGKHFCAGADINWMKQSVTLTEQQNHEDAMAFSDMLYKLNSFPRPTIARVQGAALGGGTGLICCCDIVVAETSATFALSEVRLGIIPATISPYAIRAIGARAARRYFLTGERFNASTAQRLGLVHELCSIDDIDQAINQQVEALLACGPCAQQEAKQLIADIDGQQFDTALRQELASRLARIRATDEAQEGLEAFLHKRTARWSAR